MLEKSGIFFLEIKHQLFNVHCTLSVNGSYYASTSFLCTWVYSGMSKLGYSLKIYYKVSNRIPNRFAKRIDYKIVEI